MKKGKNILALVLIFLMLFPSLSTVALESNNITKSNTINTEEVIVDNELIEENAEDISIKNEGINDLGTDVEESAANDNIITNEEILGNKPIEESIDNSLQNTEDTNIVNVEVTAEDQKENDDSSSKMKA